LLAIPIREERPFLSDAVNVGRLVAHHAHIVVWFENERCYRFEPFMFSEL
jgi:hypothetical protein